MKELKIAKFKLFLTLTIAFILSYQANAAVCPSPDPAYVKAGGSFFDINQYSGFSTAYYFFDISASGDFIPIGMHQQGFPGVILSGNRYGFYGSSTDVSTSFAVHPLTVPGSQTTITSKVYSLGGSTVCQSSFPVTVISELFPINVSMSHSGEEDLTISWNPISDADFYIIETDTSSCYRLTTNPQYSRELKVPYLSTWNVKIKAMEGVKSCSGGTPVGESQSVNYCTVNPNSSKC